MYEETLVTFYRKFIENILGDMKNSRSFFINKK